MPLCHLIVLYINFAVECLKFDPKWPLSYFQPILAAIFATKATVNVDMYKVYKELGYSDIFI